MSDTDIPALNPPAASEFLTAHGDAVLLDVRSRVEFDYVGHPVGAVHVAWKEFPDWNENPAFVDDVGAAVGAPGETGAVLVICRSGVRSLAAAKALRAAGYPEVYNVAEGFEGDRDGDSHRGTVNGWRFNGLPWEQT